MGDLVQCRAERVHVMQGEQHDHGIEGLIVIAGEVRAYGRNSRRAGGCDRGRVRVYGSDGVPGVRELPGQGALAAPGVQDPGRRRWQDFGQPGEVGT